MIPQQKPLQFLRVEGYPGSQASHTPQALKDLRNQERADEVIGKFEKLEDTFRSANGQAKVDRASEDPNRVILEGKVLTSSQSARRIAGRLATAFIPGVSSDKHFGKKLCEGVAKIEADGKVSSLEANFFDTTDQEQYNVYHPGPMFVSKKSCSGHGLFKKETHKDGTETLTFQDINVGSKEVVTINPNGTLTYSQTGRKELGQPVMHDSRFYRDDL